MNDRCPVSAPGCVYGCVDRLGRASALREARSRKGATASTDPIGRSLFRTVPVDGKCLVSLDSVALR